MESYQELYENTKMKLNEKIEFVDENIDYYSGQSNNILKYGDTETNEIYGYAEYSIYQKEISISLVFVDPKYRGQGIGEKLIAFLALKNHVKYSDINWGFTTDDGQKLKAKMDSKYGK
jgi:GNAT superfamily N-acetyltransferase